jgi:hypothetical protein
VKVCGSFFSANCKSSLGFALIHFLLQLLDVLGFSLEVATSVLKIALDGMDGEQIIELIEVCSTKPLVCL